jgi:hypothetical protein
MSAADEQEVQAALSRNDRYLVEFIETLAICPYARTCRETGRLYREVLLQTEPDAQKVATRIVELGREAEPKSQQELQIDVGLLLFPRLRLTAMEFERFRGEVQRQYQSQNGKQPVAFFVVSFHPELNIQLHNPDVAVRFMRRSPDPTLQLVRPEAIERVRGERDAELHSRQIAEAGLRAVLSRGPEKLAALLSEIRASYR